MDIDYDEYFRVIAKRSAPLTMEQMAEIRPLIREASGVEETVQIAAPEQHSSGKVAHVRQEDEFGQLVQVGQYAYRWTGPGRLAVGEIVLLPENWLSRQKCGPGPVCRDCQCTGSFLRWRDR